MLRQRCRTAPAGPITAGLSGLARRRRGRTVAVHASCVRSLAPASRRAGPQRSTRAAPRRAGIYRHDGQRFWTQALDGEMIRLSDCSSSGAGQRLQARDLRRLLRPERMPEIPILLEAEPEVRTHAGHLSEPQRRIGRDTPFRVDHFVQARKGHAELDRERRILLVVNSERTRSPALVFRAIRAAV